MPKFEVLLQREVTICETAIVEVQAESQEQAEERALERQDDCLCWNEEDVTIADVGGAYVLNCAPKSA